jgi:hypothetical protein
MRDCVSTPAVSMNVLAFCSRAVSGTSTSVSVMSAFCTARRAIFCSILVGMKPGVSFSTRKPLTWSSASLRAQMTTTSANVALPIQRLAPLSTQVSPSRWAVVSIPRATPEPTSGSVRPKAPIASKRAMRGSHSSFCSSDPQWWIEPIARWLCTPRPVATEQSTAASSHCHEPVNQHAAPAAAVALQGHPAHSELRGALPDLVRELLARPEVVDDRPDLFAHERSDVAQEGAVVAGQDRLQRVEVACGQQL